MSTLDHPAEWALCALLVLASLGVIVAKKPVHACLCFLLATLMLAGIYLQLSAQFIGVMQVLVYAGAILVLFMFVIILFQDAHTKIYALAPQSFVPWLVVGGASFITSLAWLATTLMSLPPHENQWPPHYGSVESLGKALYFDFFLPFEAMIPLFLIAIVGALYIGKKVEP